MIIGQFGHVWDERATPWIIPTDKSKGRSFFLKTIGKRWFIWTYGRMEDVHSRQTPITLYPFPPPWRLFLVIDRRFIRSTLLDRGWKSFFFFFLFFLCNAFPSRCASPCTLVCIRSYPINSLIDHEIIRGMFIRSEIYTSVCIEFETSKHRILSSRLRTIFRVSTRSHLNLYNYNYDIRIIVNNLLYRSWYSRFRRCYINDSTQSGFRVNFST